MPALAALANIVISPPYNALIVNLKNNAEYSILPEPIPASFTNSHGYFLSCFVIHCPCNAWPATWENFHGGDLYT
jgi:hypothetical protein